MQSTLLQQGLDLMLYGMGTVFVFLTLLVISVTIMSRVILRFFAAETEQTQKSIALPTSSIDPVLIDVIQDAIHQHRAKHHP